MIMWLRILTLYLLFLCKYIAKGDRDAMAGSAYASTLCRNDSLAERY